VLGVIVNTNVSVLHPVTEVYVPLVVYTVPFTDHVYESHALAVVVLFERGLTVIVMVAVEAHCPAVGVNV
jgi:hypothetical protein